MITDTKKDFDFSFPEESDKDAIMDGLREFAYSIHIKVQDYGIINHPLFEREYVIDADKTGAFPNNATLINKDNIHDKKEMSRLVEMRLRVIKENSTHVREIYWLVNKPFRLSLLSLTRSYLSEKDFNHILVDCWTMTDFPVQHRRDVGTFTKMFKLSNPKYLYEVNSDEEEIKKSEKQDQKFFTELPAVVTAYRGRQSNQARIRSLSWTLSLEKARWFANRLNTSGGVFKANINKEDVFYYTDSRKEIEVVVNPYKLKNVVKIE